jgi:hypothetical protein
VTGALACRGWSRPVRRGGGVGGRAAPLVRGEAISLALDGSDRSPPLRVRGGQWLPLRQRSRFGPPSVRLESTGQDGPAVAASPVRELVRDLGRRHGRALVARYRDRRSHVGRTRGASGCIGRAGAVGWPVRDESVPRGRGYPSPRSWSSASGTWASAPYREAWRQLCQEHVKTGSGSVLGFWLSFGGPASWVRSSPERDAEAGPGWRGRTSGA